MERENEDITRLPEGARTRRDFLFGAAAAGACIAVSGMQEAGAGEMINTHTFDVAQFGAKGDGKADDTAAVQAAVDAVIKAGGGCVRIPAGRYRIGKSITFTSSKRVDIVGDGASSTILHEADEPVFLWKEGVSCMESSIRHLCFTSTAKDKSISTPVIACLGGSERSFFSHLFFNTAGARMGSGIVVENVMDTTTIDHCLMWGPVSGTGIRVAKGSEVRIFGGRILGAMGRDKASGEENIGIHLVGNNGGVHVVTSDLIALNTAMKIGEPGGQSNREVFLTHATFDSCFRGYWQIDNAYTSIAGCWSASSDEFQIMLDESAWGAIMSISGGTIFNGGAYGRPGKHHGIVVRAGSFMLNGVTVRHNKGTGILVEGDNVRDYAITGCRIVHNGTGAVLAGDSYTFTGNIVAHNATGLKDNGGPNKQVQANVVQQ